MIFDAHCDSISVALDKNISICDKNLAFNIEDAHDKLPYIQTLAIFIAPKFKDGFKRANDILDKFYKEYELNEKNLFLIKNAKDIKENLSKIGIILSIENGSAIGEKIDNIDLLYDRGIRIMSATWNEDNKIGCGALTTNDTGLTKFGREYIKKLNEKNIIIDVSHASKKTFYDIIDLSKNNVIATHSCSQALCNHKRNLDDEQIKKLASMGGVIGICFYSKFLREKEKATSEDIINHIMHIVDLVGIEHVGIGSDFDGMDEEFYPKDIKGVKDLEIIIEKLKKKGLNNEEIEKIMGNNFCDFVRKNI